MPGLFLYIRDLLYVPLAGLAMWAHSMVVNSTLRIDFITEQKIDDVHNKGQRAIFAFWHQATFSLIYYYRRRKICLLPVDNYLGGILAVLAALFRYRAIRYPQGGTPMERVTAISKIIRTIKGGYDCGIAVDGPPGEKLYEAKPGVFYLALRTGFPIIPVGVHYERASTFRFRWDKYLVPKPFSRVTILLGEPIYVNNDPGETGFEPLCRSLEDELHRLTEKAKEISRSKGRAGRS